MIQLRTYLTKKHLLMNFLEEDIGLGDITSNALIKQDQLASAQIICKTDDMVIVSGIEEASIVFDLCHCKVINLVSDGALLTKNKVVMTIRGRAKSILKAERTALNLLMRMSGISTETKRLIDAMGSYKRYARIASTRKTSPGMRIFDKKAVRLGGGEMHRVRLDDMALIKDNHLAIAGSVSSSIRKVKRNIGSSIKVECEVTNLHDLISAIQEGADVVMLDNFSAKNAKKALDQIARMGLRNKARIELSGRIDLTNIKDYASAKPDIISVGYITHSAKAVDYSLDIIHR